MGSFSGQFTGFMVFAICHLVLLLEVLLGAHMCAVGLGSKARTCFTGVASIRSLPSRTRKLIWRFRCLCLSNPLSHRSHTSAFVCHTSLFIHAYYRWVNKNKSGTCCCGSETASFQNFFVEHVLCLFRSYNRHLLCIIFTRQNIVGTKNL